MDRVIINNMEYEVVENDRNCFNLEETSEKMTDYFNSYDYIFGDYAYDKLRLKGFYESTNKNANEINNIEELSMYKKEYCSYGAKTFLLKNISKRL